VGLGKISSTVVSKAKASSDTGADDCHRINQAVLDRLFKIAA